MKLAVLGGEPVRTKPFVKWPIHGIEEETAVLRVVRSGNWGRYVGEETLAFEARFAEIHGCRRALAVPSGTVALKVALLAAGIRSGDEVLIPAYTFLATGTAVIEVNATPVPVDVDPLSYTMDPNVLEAAVTERTRFIMPVHIAGLPADMDPILAIAKRHNLTVIEDACQAHGARYKDRSVGSMGVMGCFSMQGSKNVNSGEGGVIVTNDADLADRCEAIHNCGRAPDGGEIAPTPVNTNYRITELQSALANCQLSRLEEQGEIRRRNAAQLDTALAEIPGLNSQAHDHCTRHAYHLYSFRYDAEAFGVSRSVFARAMHAEGIPVAEGYTQPIYRLPMFVRGDFGPYQAPAMDVQACAARCPVSERACASEGAWLFHSLLLGTEADTQDIADAFRKVWELRGSLREVTT
jgi:dTDP-4-amino-4,6-dideoxygalactose transaminase